MRSVFISGEAVTWQAGASARVAAIEEAWKLRIREALRDDYPTPKTILVHFSVESWLRRGNRFDLDNLVTPVMGAIYGKNETDRPAARAALAGWRATIGQSPTPYLLLDFSDDDLLNPEQTCDCQIVIDKIWTGLIPTDSQKVDCGLPVWIQKNIGNHVPSDDQRFGVHLVFGNVTRSISRPEGKPIKPVVDCMYPIFGGGPGCGQDWKKCLLQVERRNDFHDSCHIRCWLLNKRPATD